MTEIPEDVMRIARKISDSWGNVCGESYEGYFEADLADDIARALMAERERCASLCEMNEMAIGIGPDNRMYGGIYLCVSSSCKDRGGIHAGMGYAERIRRGDA